MKHQFLYLLFIFCFVTVATLLAQTDNKLRTENSLNDMLPGGGTAEDPYLISDYQSLKKVKNNLSAYYLVTMDIDASASKSENGGMGFEPIGSCNVPFKGHFKGNGHYIKNLYVNRSDADNVGLFRCLSGATIDALGLIYCTIIGHDSIGSICGSNINSSSINNCYFSGTVSGNSYVGGCVGINRAIISCCYATGRVFGNRHILGGLAGFNGSKGSINNCYAIVSVNGYYEAGGLVGFSDLSKITNCYTAGKVSGNDTGGLVGYDFWSTITNSYDNFETSCQIDRVVAGESKSTIELKKQSTFTDWDFKMIWVMSSGNSYPGLRSINNAPFA
ncbi:MAG: GLUG motif-containing protein, partial [Bacteroidota bacterium]|nr:GLUG motif-containing protein [Bacteroidota bacterium]